MKLQRTPVDIVLLFTPYLIAACVLTLIGLFISHDILTSVVPILLVFIAILMYGGIVIFEPLYLRFISYLSKFMR